MPVIPALKRTEILRSYFQTAKLEKNMTLATNKKLGKIVKSCNDKENKASVRLFSLKE